MNSMYEERPETAPSAYEAGKVVGHAAVSVAKDGIVVGEAVVGVPVVAAEAAVGVGAEVFGGLFHFVAGVTHAEEHAAAEEDADERAAAAADESTD
jgi:hypothetical protein